MRLSHGELVCVADRLGRLELFLFGLTCRAARAAAAEVRAGAAEAPGGQRGRDNEIGAQDIATRSQRKSVPSQSPRARSSSGVRGAGRVVGSWMGQRCAAECAAAFAAPGWTGGARACHNGAQKLEDPPHKWIERRVTPPLSTQTPCTQWPLRRRAEWPLRRHRRPLRPRACPSGAALPRRPSRPSRPRRRRRPARWAGRMARWAGRMARWR
eukprot:scaffold28154_cov101-Isochrysis_galbana.AAC.1